MSSTVEHGLCLHGVSSGHQLIASFVQTKTVEANIVSTKIVSHDYHMTHPGDCRRQEGDQFGQCVKVLVETSAILLLHSLLFGMFLP